MKTSGEVEPYHKLVKTGRREKSDDGEESKIIKYGNYGEDANTLKFHFKGDSP